MKWDQAGDSCYSRCKRFDIARLSQRDINIRRVRGLVGKYRLWDTTRREPNGAMYMDAFTYYETLAEAKAAAVSRIPPLEQLAEAAE